jgi:hypothetical protein
MSLNGFLIDVWNPSESSLEVEIDCSGISWEEYRSLIVELEDLLSDIDERHSARSWLVKGRGLKGKYKRITAEDRRRHLRFSPFPSKFSNVLRNTRAYVYELVSSNCLLLEAVGRRKVWLLPKQLAPSFLEIIDGLNEDVIKPLREGIEEFRKSDDYLRIKQCLFRHNVDPSVLDRADFHISDYVVDVLPVDFGYSVDADEVYAKMDRNKAARGLEVLRRQVERRRREYMVNVVSDVVRRITEFTELLTRKGGWRNAGKKVEKLMSMCSALGLEDVNRKVLEPLKKICDARYYQRPKLVRELFGAENLKDAVERALKDVAAPLLEVKS